METKFIFNGGLGNQIFQYLASKYLLNNIKDLKISYSLSEYILSGSRSFKLNKLLVKPLSLIKKNNKTNLDITPKFITCIPFLNKEKKHNIQFRLKLLNQLYEEQLYPSYFEDPLLKLFKYLNSIKNSNDQLKISGYWQNPSCYINEIENYMTFIETKKFLPKRIEPNKYITIHIRREDYFLNKGTLNFYFSKFSPIKFILLSLQLLPQEYKNMPIYLLSDDQSWKHEMKSLLSNVVDNKFICIDTNNHLEDWYIIKNASINICSNSTFSYTAALLNNENREQKLRCILPQWINSHQTAFEKGWLTPKGFIDI